MLIFLPLSRGAIGAIIFIGGCSKISKSSSHSRFPVNSMKFIWLILLLPTTNTHHKYTNFYVSFTYTIYSLHNTLNIYLLRLWKLPTLLLIFSTLQPILSGCFQTGHILSFHRLQLLNFLLTLTSSRVIILTHTLFPAHFCWKILLLHHKIILLPPYRTLTILDYKIISFGSTTKVISLSCFFNMIEIPK